MYYEPAQIYIRVSNLDAGERFWDEVLQALGFIRRLDLNRGDVYSAADGMRNGRMVLVTESGWSRTFDRREQIVHLYWTSDVTNLDPVTVHYLAPSITAVQNFWAAACRRGRFSCIEPHFSAHGLEAAIRDPDGNEMYALFSPSERARIFAFYAAPAPHFHEYVDRQVQDRDQPRPRIGVRRVQRSWSSEEDDEPERRLRPVSRSGYGREENLELRWDERRDASWQQRQDSDRYPRRRHWDFFDTAFDLLDDLLFGRRRR